ncbi:hypothetical protein pb186bvf_012251 [Paramecium bursaria]
MNKKFFQLRTMTKNLDESFKGDQEYLKKFCLENKSERSDFTQDKILIQEWITYKDKNITQIITQCWIQESPFKICLCDFLKNRRVSLEFWFRVLYDVFNNDQEGKNLRCKFWSRMRTRAMSIQQDLTSRQWPHDWSYLEKEPCLNLEILKLYESYPPIRVFFALNINQLASERLFVDVRRLPMFQDERTIEIEIKNGWVDRLLMQVPSILNNMEQVSNLYCNNIIEFCHKMYNVVVPILKSISNKKAQYGHVVNLYGENYEFMYEVLNSLKSACGTYIRTCNGSLKISREYKNQKQMGYSNFIIVSIMQESDVNNEVIEDIRNNINKGYNSFSQFQGSPTPKLIIILSISQLRLKVPQVEYQKLESKLISAILEDLDYEFLVYYSNILYEKTMVVQQNGGNRKPYFQLFITMWAYVFPKFYQGCKFTQRKIEKQGFQDNKYNSAQNLKRLDESDFNLSKFRETLYSKINNFKDQPLKEIKQEPLKESNFYVRSGNSTLKQRHDSNLPSFDDLLRNMSTKKQDKENINNSLTQYRKQDSNRKFSGIQTKIEQIGLERFSSKIEQQPPRFSSQSKIYNETPKSKPPSQSFLEKPIIMKPSGKSLTESLPLRELVEIRSRIEQSSSQDIQSLSVNYVSELVKLAQVITKQIRKSKF